MITEVSIIEFHLIWVTGVSWGGVGGWRLARFIKWLCVKWLGLFWNINTLGGCQAIVLFYLRENSVLLESSNANASNLKNIDLRLPLHLPIVMLRKLVDDTTLERNIMEDCLACLSQSQSTPPPPPDAPTHRHAYAMPDAWFSEAGLRVDTTWLWGLHVEA